MNDPVQNTLDQRKHQKLYSILNPRIIKKIQVNVNFETNSVLNGPKWKSCLTINSTIIYFQEMLKHNFTIFLQFLNSILKFNIFIFITPTTMCFPNQNTLRIPLHIISIKISCIKNKILYPKTLEINTKIEFKFTKSSNQSPQYRQINCTKYKLGKRKLIELQRNKFEINSCDTPLSTQSLILF